MGVHHGVVCAGCCWALMAIMFPLGMMNIAALGAVTVLIFAERVLPRGRLVQHASGAVLPVLGLAALVRPDLLPGATTPMDATMPMG
jgi:predicted metal-binding membrane protein